MPVSTQQDALDMSKQWQGWQGVNNNNSQNFIDNRVGKAQQQQKADYNQQYNQQLTDMTNWAQNANSIKTNTDIIARQRQDNQQAAQLQQSTLDRADANKNSYGGSSSTSYGMNAAPPSGYGTNVYGQRTPYNPDTVSDWQDNQDRVATNNARMSQANAAGDIARTQAQTDAQSRLTTQQAGIDAAKQSQQNNFNSQQAAADRASQLNLATLQSYSINPGSFKYWG